MRTPWLLLAACHADKVSDEDVTTLCAVDTTSSFSATVTVTYDLDLRNGPYVEDLASSLHVFVFQANTTSLLDAEGDTGPMDDAYDLVSDMADGGVAFDEPSSFAVHSGWTLASATAQANSGSAGDGGDTGGQDYVFCGARSEEICVDAGNPTVDLSIVLTGDLCDAYGNDERSLNGV